MFWLAIGAVSIVGFVMLLAILLAKRPMVDVGSVSAHWMAEYRSSTRNDA